MNGDSAVDVLVDSVSDGRPAVSADTCRPGLELLLGGLEQSTTLLPEARGGVERLVEDSLRAHFRVTVALNSAVDYEEAVGYQVAKPIGFVDGELYRAADIQLVDGRAGAQSAAGAAKARRRISR